MNQSVMNRVRPHLHPSSVLHPFVSVGWCLILLVSLWPAGVFALTVDLNRCQVGGISFVRALKKDQHGNFTPEAEALFVLTPFNGIHLGMCLADVRHGQAMLIKLIPQDRPRTPQVIPRLIHGMSRAGVEAIFGQPNVHHADQLYREVLLSGNRMGSTGQWAGLCPGFTVQFTFDNIIGLTRIVVLPMDVREP